MKLLSVLGKWLSVRRALAAVVACLWPAWAYMVLLLSSGSAVLASRAGGQTRPLEGYAGMGLTMISPLLGLAVAWLAATGKRRRSTKALSIPLGLVAFLASTMAGLRLIRSGFPH